jgi:hypothetical protein
MRGTILRENREILWSPLSCVDKGRMRKSEDVIS